MLRDAQFESLRVLYRKENQAKQQKKEAEVKAKAERRVYVPIILLASDPFERLIPLFEQDPGGLITVPATQRRPRTAIPRSHRYELYQLQSAKQIGTCQWDDGLSVC